MLLFHAGFAWMSGGYFGVSVFFTLSGFLITRLLLAEATRTQRVALRRFYARRARRLLPASMLCIAVVMVARMLGAFSEVRSLRSDAVGALTQTFNWVRLNGTTSYADLFDSVRNVSPFEHYWSLAIEEQFYLVWPITVVVITALCRRRGMSVTRVLGVLTASSVGVAFLVADVWGSQAAYWATPARFGEILTGATLASYLHHRTTAPQVHRAVAPVALGGVVALSVVLPATHGIAYDGWLPVLSLVSAALVLGLQSPGIVTRALSSAPLATIGRISYGIYLFHWPVFVLLREHDVDLARPLGFLGALAISVAVAGLSYTVVEMPIRRNEWRPIRIVSLAAGGLAAVLVVVALAPAAEQFLRVDQALLDQAEFTPVDSLAPLTALVPAGATAATGLPGRASPTPTPASDATNSSTDESTDDDPSSNGSPVADAGSGAGSGESATTELQDTDAPSTTTAPTTTTTMSPTSLPLPAAPVRPVRILVVGDSLSINLGTGLASWSVQNPSYAQTSVLWALGCGFLQSGHQTTFDTPVDPNAAAILETTLPHAVTTEHPDVVMLVSILNDVLDREWDDAEGPLAPTDDRFRERLIDAYRHTTQALLDEGAPQVVWIIPPTPLVAWKEPEMRDPARYQVQHDVIRQIVAEFGPQVHAIDLDRWSQDTHEATDLSWRPDGVHLADDNALSLASTYLGPRLIDIALGLESSP